MENLLELPYVKYTILVVATLLVAFIIYELLRFVRGTHAEIGRAHV